MTLVKATVVDTDVLSILYVHKTSADPRAAEWRAQLTSHRVLISLQTRAEVLEGALTAGWGDRRFGDLRGLLKRMPTIRPDNLVIDAYATLTASCRTSGHAL